LHLIAGKGRWDADGLAAELECSRRTVYRLLQTLSMAGVPWYFDNQAECYRVRRGFTFPGIEGGVSLKGTKPANLATELQPIAKKLVADGEEFVASLRQFLDALDGTPSHSRTE
jgi:predicted DNA-binding transcriptional regulator YafY